MIKFNYRNLIYALVISHCLMACNNRVYNNNIFLNQNASSKKTIAILPAEVVLSGKFPKNMTNQDKVLQEKTESKFYQELLYSEFLDKSSTSNKKKYGFHFLNPTEVNNKLTKANFDNTIKDKSIQEIATAIGADMIFVIKINKQRLMSDDAALGLEIAENIFNKVLNPSNQNTNTTTNKTHNISYDVTLIDGQTGTTVSKLANLKDANWTDTPERILRRNCARTTRKTTVYAID